MRLVRVVLVLSLGIPWLGAAGPAQADSPKVAAPAAASPATVESSQPLLGATAAVEVARAATDLAGKTTDGAARRALTDGAAAEVKLARKLLARAVDRTRADGDKARAAELGRLNVALSRFEREVHAAGAAGDPAVARAAVQSAGQRADELRTALLGLSKTPAARGLALGLWRVAASDSPQRSALAAPLGAALLDALATAEPKPDPEAVRRCREAIERATAKAPPPSPEAWGLLAGIASELVHGS